MYGSHYPGQGYFGQEYQPRNNPAPTYPTGGVAGTFNELEFNAVGYNFGSGQRTVVVVVGGTGQIKYYNGSAFVAKPVKVWTGSAWVTKPVKRWNGTAWTVTNY